MEGSNCKRFVLKTVKGHFYKTAGNKDMFSNLKVFVHSVQYILMNPSKNNPGKHDGPQFGFLNFSEVNEN